MPSCAPRAGHSHHRAKGPPSIHPSPAFFNQRWLKLQSSRNCVVTQVKTNKTAWLERPTSSSPFFRADLLPLCKLYSSLIDGFETSEARSSSNAHHCPLFRLPSFRFPHQTMLVHDHDGLQVAGETHRCYEYPVCGVVLPRQPRLALSPPLSVPRKTPYGRWKEIRIGSAASSCSDSKPSICGCKRDGWFLEEGSSSDSRFP